MLQHFVEGEGLGIGDWGEVTGRDLRAGDGGDDVVENTNSCIGLGLPGGRAYRNGDM